MQALRDFFSQTNNSKGDRVEKSTICASCGSPLEPHAGAGRPAVYCGPVCRRASEFAIRRVIARLDKAEVELRDVRAGSGSAIFLDQAERRSRARVLKRWIAEDRAKLRALLGAKESNSVANNQMTKEKP